jgi:endonuclease III
MALPRGAQARADEVRVRLAARYPDAECALVHENAFQLLVATILSAQTTDDNVNKVTPTLFTRYPTPRDLAHADPEDVEAIVHSTGFFRSKAKNIIGMARALDDDFDGEVPTELEALVTLPGVGRKTANVVRSVAFALPGLPVDTHVGRLSRRLRLTDETDPVKAELELNRLVPPDERGRFSLRLILHGRQVCFARNPDCDGCVLVDICPSAAPTGSPTAAQAATRGRSGSPPRGRAPAAPS